MHSQSSALLHESLFKEGEFNPNAPALRFKAERCSYGELAQKVMRVSESLQHFDSGTRIAVLLPNCPESVVAAYASFASGNIFVPINPLLRPRQIQHILNDSGASVLVTARYLLDSFTSTRELPGEITTVVLIDDLNPGRNLPRGVKLHSWSYLLHGRRETRSAADETPKTPDPAVLLYTSGSTGLAKGILISHQNLIDGAEIVSGYLGNTRNDRILAALPVSFDYGFSQVTTSLLSGAELVLTNFSLPQQLVSEIVQNRVTGLAGVPTMWQQLIDCSWPAGCDEHLRYITNSGGRLSRDTLARLRSRFGKTRVFLMYGLTEAFRSSYLDPDLIDERPDSIGKALPGVQLHVVNERGELCAPGEPGELVHSGKLVTLGYWNNPAASANRFRPPPSSCRLDTAEPPSVWTGDIVTLDSDGFLYFSERADQLLKCSGYRVSPSEIEQAILESGLADEVVAVGLPDERRGHRVAIALVPSNPNEDNDFAIRHVCARELPPYMQPEEILVVEALPVTPNGKPDRQAIRSMFRTNDSAS